CRASPPPWRTWPGRAPTPGHGRISSAGPAWSPAAAPATIRTAACGSSAARCACSRPRPGCTSRGGAAARTRARSCRFRLARPRPRRTGADMEKQLCVDPVACAGHGACAELLPELITLDEWGYPIVADQPVPHGLQREARRAVAGCPALALALARVA